MEVGTRGSRIGLLIAAIAAVLALFAPPASAAPPYPVSYNFADALAAQGAGPDSPPPGSNDWSCRPSTVHPEPVILVHGLLANQTVNFNTISPLLANDGHCVFSLTYGTKSGVTSPLYQPGGLTKIEQSAEQLKAFVDRVRAATGAAKVDIVGHSEGSLMPNYYVRFLGGNAVVDDYVGLTTLWAGTNPAGLATVATLGLSLGLTPVVVDALAPLCESCPQFLTGSEFIEKMNEGGVADPAVTYTNIVTKLDELVVPYTSGLMAPGPNVTNHVVQDLCVLDLAEHLTVAADPVATTLIQNALLPEPARRPVPCTAVIPPLGAPGYKAPAPLDSDGDGTPDYALVGHSTDPPANGAAGQAVKKPRAKCKKKAKKKKSRKAKRRCRGKR
jgi:triacylglycerol esterase/lipase EstA (alpha/beta hydrolase family)